MVGADGVAVVEVWVGTWGIDCAGLVVVMDVRIMASEGIACPCPRN